MKRNILQALCVAVTVCYGISGWSQGVTDYTANLASFKVRYPKTDVIAVNYREEYQFNLKTASNASSMVGAQCAVSSTLVPLKDFATNRDAIFYDGESEVDGISAVNSKNRNILYSIHCSDYETDGIFYSDAKVCVVSMPLEEKGMPASYSYYKKYKDVKYLTSVYFHEQVPIEEKTLVFNIPDWLQVDLREFNFKGYDIKKEVQKDAAANVTKYIYHLQHIPALEREINAPNLAKSYPHIIVVSKSFTENGQKKVLFESVKDLYNWYYTLRREVHNQPEELKPLVSQLTTGKKTDIEKIESVYYWVQDKIRYIAFENGIMGFKPDAAQNVLKNKYGDCKGKANLLTEMLRIAGYDARLTWIGTADLPYDYTLPSLVVDNHMICTVILNGKKYYLDGTEMNVAFNDYAHRIQGKEVLIEDGDKYILDKIPEFPAERNKIESAMKLKIEGDVLSGAVTTIYHGESKSGLAASYQLLRNENKNDVFGNFLRRGNANLSISNIREPDWNDRQSPLQVAFDIQARHRITKAANELYITLDWEKELSDLEFDSTRHNDYELDHKVCISTQIELAIPDGYKVDYLPDALSVKNANYAFDGMYVNKGNSLVYTKKILVNVNIIRKADFAAWNELIRSMNKFYTDQVVLVKK